MICSARPPCWCGLSMIASVSVVPGARVPGKALQVQGLAPRSAHDKAVHECVGSLCMLGADETPDIERILAAAASTSGARGGRDPAQLLTVKTLPGSHITPCGGDVAWPVGRVFTPLDAAIQLGKVVQQADVRRLGDEVVSYLEAAEAR